MKHLALLLAVTALTGCVTSSLDFDSPPAFCGEGALGQLRLATAPPVNASALRALADSSPNFPAGRMTYPIEHWFLSASGDQMLCRRDKSTCSGEWWQFQHGNGAPTISRQDGWICVTGAGA
jgi:hypothetical protein